jgi:serine/threonine protein kinase
MAPELLVGTMFVDEDTDDADALVNPMLCDLWALGIVLLRVLTGESLISEAVESNEDYQNIVLKGDLAAVLDDLGLPSLSVEVMEIIQGLLRKDPTQRMSLREILSHRWMNP